MQKKLLQGLVKRNPDGFGFFVPDDREIPDIYVPRHSMQGIMTNDRVMIEMEKEKGGDRFRGEIVEVLERKTKRVVGLFAKLNEKTAILKDESKSWGQDLKIRSEHWKGADNGQLVVAEITHYPDTESFEGKIVEIVGNPEDPLTDVKRVLVQNNIPYEFPADVERQAAHFKPTVSAADMQGRKDLQHLKFITIDGATAKDFDDAIFVEQVAQGFLLYVAIADVAHYVQIGTPIDKEAYDRGTSVYFPNFVVPMLPEILSNELCSLKPNIPRLSMVAEMLMDHSGNTISSKFYDAVIRSHARVTYGEAQELLENQSIDNLNHVKEEVIRASHLAKILMAKRFKEGSLDLEVPEVEIQVDASGVPVDMVRSERLFSHRLIEELMLAANVAVATFLSSKGIPTMFRVHEPPNEMAIGMLEKYMQNFGSTARLGGGSLQKKLTKALQEFSGKPEAIVLNILTLRSMSQAKYSGASLGHFGLGFEFYSHFTSPIRRYPDLIIHRLLKSQVQPQSKFRPLSEEDLETASVMLSACEQRSVKAERQFEAIKKARFMDRFVGKEFEGMISSVTRFGMFVLLREMEVDGLVRLDDLGSERYEFDEERLALVARRSGHAYAIGDEVKIRVDSVDIEAGQVNFALAGEFAKKRTARFAEGRDDRGGRRPARNEGRRGGGGRSDKKRPNSEEKFAAKKDKKFSKKRQQDFKDSSATPKKKKDNRRDHNFSDRQSSEKKKQRFEDFAPKATPRQEEPVKKEPKSLYDQIMTFEPREGARGSIGFISKTAGKKRGGKGFGKKR